MKKMLLIVALATALFAVHGAARAGGFGMYPDYEELQAEANRQEQIVRDNELRLEDLERRQSQMQNDMNWRANRGW